ncbi:FkbM family methyltransferase [Pseudochryseolinea flava]|uniref:Methyltransferase FkbM domain-containing protein n=1 Tax=Pseudochryseolinea flava TaxID=2059302 RepID=A0A364Y6G7_9BACT|nr:FkbM family methyltransferase [Pseudochryseolinea flava]RAW02651.1 hypothetical protein DQQ10_00645 [Pseudochryseolinea flava]
MLLLLRILNKLNLLSFLNLTSGKVYNGVRYSIPLHGRTGLGLLGDFEPWMLSILRKLIPEVKGKVFVDVGMNIGQTMLAAKSVDSGLAYLGFEPNPSCVVILKRLVECNNIRDVKIIPAAVGASDGVSVLYRSKNQMDDGEATIIQHFRDTAGKEQLIVPTISTKTIQNIGLGKVGVIKIDVEGAEVDVVEAFMPIIEKDHPYVICEILPAYSNQNTFRIERQQRLVMAMKGAGYKIFRIETTGSLKPIDDIGVHDVLDDSNYLFVSDENIKTIESIFSRVTSVK